MPRRHLPPILPFLLPLLVLGVMLTACHSSGKRGGTPAEASPQDAQAFTMEDILSSGQLIVGTLSGPETYFTFRGAAFGLHYEMASLFAREQGLSLRVEVARDTAELLSWLSKAEVDLLALPLPQAPGTLGCSPGWLVAEGMDELREAVDDWYDPGLPSRLRREQAEHRSKPLRRHKARPQMLNPGKGIISPYDRLFQRYAPKVSWDWRLLAAQCWQESAFDPRALSWAGARGLMQIMPATGARLGLSDPWDPEQNIAAAVAYIGELQRKFSDVADPRERLRFVLAAYNGGPGHIRDAMSLCASRGGNAKRWSEVERYVRLLSRPAYYNDPHVHHGYMIGSETASYVSSIVARWEAYRGKARAIAPVPKASAPAVNPRVRPRSDFFPSDSL